MDIHTLARPILRSLIGTGNEAASVAILDAADVAYVERVQVPLGRLGITPRIGSRVPAYCTAVGHAILAYMPLEQRVQLLNAKERETYAEHAGGTCRN